MLSLIQEHKDLISELCRKFNVSKLEVFGSAARMDDFIQGHSDIDFAVEFSAHEKWDHWKNSLVFGQNSRKFLGEMSSWWNWVLLKIHMCDKI